MRQREIYVDMRPGGATSGLALHNGEGGIPLLIRIFEGGASSDMSDWKSCAMLITRPSGDTGEIPCEIDGDTVKCSVTQELTKEAGEVMAELQFAGEDEGTLLLSEPIKVTVSGTPHAKAYELSRTEKDKRQRFDSAMEFARKAAFDYEGAASEYKAAAQMYREGADLLKAKADDYIKARITADKESAEDYKAIIEGLRADAEKRINAALEKLDDNAKASKKNIDLAKAECENRIKDAIETLTEKTDDEISKIRKAYTGKLEASLHEYAERTEQAVTQAGTAAQGFAMAAQAYKDAQKAMQEAVEMGGFAIARQALDLAKQAQRSADEATERITTIEAIEESLLIKKGGEKD